MEEHGTLGGGRRAGGVMAVRVDIVIVVLLGRDCALCF